MPSIVLETSEADYQGDVANQAGLTLVDFWAPWCGPCKTLAPLLEEIALDYAGELRVVKINADEAPNARETNLVRGLPTLILFRDGVEIDRIVGAAGKTRIAAAIDKQIEA